MGETPVIEHPYKRDKISLISGVSVSPQQQRLGLYYLLFYDNIGQEEVILFLREYSAICGVRSWSCCKPHTELNPDEGVWCQAKGSLANGCSKDLEELTEDVMRAVDAIKSSPDKLRACIEASELPSFLR